MQITIKVLQGSEHQVQCDPSLSVLEFKKLIENEVKVPYFNQKLLLNGRALVNENKISSYPNIQSGSKLTLVVKKPESLKDTINKCFKKYYDENNSEKLAEEFMSDFEKKLKTLSLEDIERIATTLLTHDQEQNLLDFQTLNQAGMNNSNNT